MPRFAANLSMLFGEHDFLKRFGAAANAGFSAVELQFPYEFHEETIAQQLQQHSLEMVLFNLPAGNWRQGERGIACHPERLDEFRAGVEKAIRYASVLGVTRINCLAGIRPSRVSEAEAMSTFVGNLVYASTKLEKVGIELVIEAINSRDVPGFLLGTTKQALEVLDRVGSDNLKLQYDVYHMQIMEGDICRTIQNSLDRIGHIQIADSPGRHEPGTGELNYDFILRWLDDIGYRGWIGCEYVPAAGTAEGLAWSQRFLNTVS